MVWGPQLRELWSKWKWNGFYSVFLQNKQTARHWVFLFRPLWQHWIYKVHGCRPYTELLTKSFLIFQVFEGAGNNCNISLYHLHLTAKYIRFLPVKWDKGSCLQFTIHGNIACKLMLCQVWGDKHIELLKIFILFIIVLRQLVKGFSL